MLGLSTLRSWLTTLNSMIGPTAGSSAVAPYTESGARFPLEASQFEVIDQRPFEEILGEFTAAGVRFENYDSNEEPGSAA